MSAASAKRYGQSRCRTARDRTGARGSRAVAPGAGCPTSCARQIAPAAEAKIPTASNRQISTGKGDVTPYLIASKRVGAVDGHVNVGYSFVGTPADLAVQNTLKLAVALEARPPVRPRHGGRTAPSVAPLAACHTASVAAAATATGARVGPGCRDRHGDA